MADNVDIADNSGSGVKAATDKVTYSGDTADVQLVRPVLVTGSEGAKTVVDLPGDNTDGLLVNLGTNNDVAVSSIAAGTNNIGDVDVASIAAGDNNIGNVDIVTVPAPLSTTGGGTEATALRVTLANDSTGVISIDDGGNVITVDGTITANAGTNLNTSALALEAGGNLDSITTNTGNVDTNTTDIPNIISVDDTSTHTAATTKALNIGVVAVPTDTTVNANDIAMPGMSTDRRLWTDTQIVGQDADLTIADGGNSITVDWNGTAPPIGAGLEATALRVTLATDSTGVISIDDGGNVITVDGTITANAGTNLNTSALALESGGNLATIATKATDIETNTDFGATTGGGTETGALRVTLANNSTGLLSVDDNGGSLSIDVGGTAPTLGTGTRDSGTLRVTVATDDVVPASQSGTWTVQPGNTANTTPWLTSQVPASSGGLTMHKTVSAASTNATSVKASAGQLYSIYVSNVNAAARYFKLYNKASAPTVGTDTPVQTYLIPGNTAGAGFSVQIPSGLAFSTGIAFALTTGVADSDTAAVSANEHVVNLGYK